MATLVRATSASFEPGSMPARRWRTALAVDAIELDVRLGCEEEERRVPQKVHVALSIRFDDPPAACWTDAIGDTACYAELAAIALAHASSREFRLVEHLAAELHERLRARLPRGARLDLEVEKIAPPVAELRGSVRFRIIDREGRRPSPPRGKAARSLLSPLASLGRALRARNTRGVEPA